jgi:hypothetical protein
MMTKTVWARRLGSAILSCVLFVSPAVAGELTLKALRPKAQTPLQIAFVALQAADLASTMRALHGGHASESNPLLQSVVQSPASFIATKAAVSVGTILLSNKLSKRSKGAALALLVIVDGVYAGAVLQNMRAAR